MAHVCNVILAGILATMLGLLPSTLKSIHKWERENSYPYGKMCEPHLLNAYVDTCRRK